MELSFAKCESIVNTLPIGLYTGRRIPLELARDEQTSFYSITEDSIVISYPIINHRCKQIVDGSCDEEEAVRSMVYHEVSHAILTPELNNSYMINCVEDQRVETVLGNYYHNVDFRKQLYDIHGGHIPKVKDAQGAFFNAVRFGIGTAKVQKEVRRIIKNYSKINRTTKRYETNCCDIYHYEDDIYKLWCMIEEEYEKDPEAFSGTGETKSEDQNQNQNQNQNQTQNQGQNQKEEKMYDAADAADIEDTKENNATAVNTDKYNIQNDPLHDLIKEINIPREALKRFVGACISKDAGLSNVEKERLDDFKKIAETIINNFRKKNTGGSGINTYSGIFNPRAITRNDYRYFERSMPIHGNNKFGSCHLNLIIDSSGSFCNNVKLTNGILSVLTDIEKKNRNFSMDVIFINHTIRICKTVRDRNMTAFGGNSVPVDMKEILMRMQKPQTCNYNIILFDGDAVCNDYLNHAEACKRFRAFDMKQATLITDPDNERYMDVPFTSTKVVVTKEYTKELIKHITNALTVAFD